jgi:uncharacterized membrane protein
MILVTLYSRADCHLCDQAIDDLLSLQSQFPHKLKIIDIGNNQDLQHLYGEEIPVVEIGGIQLNSPISRQEMQTAFLTADRIGQPEQSRYIYPTVLGNKKKERWTKADGFSYWFSKHYLAVFNLMVIIYIGLPFLAPVFAKAGATTPATFIYRSYGLVCHQLSFRSIFIFGEQLFYPRSAAEVDGLLTYSQATGLGEGNSTREIFGARDYIGDNHVGYKVALCQRDIAIYAAILLFGLLYALTGRRLPALPWSLWILFGLVPIGLDGLSQLLSQPPFNFWPYRESTPFFRILTGALFGFTTAWFGYPLVEETMADTRTMMKNKLERVKQAKSESGG